eukprot:608517-Pyramimonas_sp.AAC.1
MAVVVVVVVDVVVVGNPLRNLQGTLKSPYEIDPLGDPQDIRMDPQKPLRGPSGARSGKLKGTLFRESSRNPKGPSGIPKQSSGDPQGALWNPKRESPIIPRM